MLGQLIPEAQRNWRNAMEVYNQYRIKDIPKKDISKRDLLRIVKESCTVVEDAGDLIRVKYRWGPSMAFEWNVSIEDKGTTNDLVIENLEDPWTRFGEDALWSGRRLAYKIRTWIIDWIQEEET